MLTPTVVPTPSHRRSNSISSNEAVFLLAAVFCRYSSYQTNPVVVLNLKKVFFKACGFTVKTSGLPKKKNEIVISKVYTENPKAPKSKQCNSIKQTTLTEVSIHSSFRGQCISFTMVLHEVLQWGIRSLMCACTPMRSLL
jgi:hypothetical protein